MNNLPDILSRKAIINIFDNISPTSWEKLFEREDNNGIAKFRCDGDFPGKAYYSTAGLLQWLVRNARYTPQQIIQSTDFAPRPKQPIINVRTHILAG